MKNKAGFTLIEVLIALAILSIALTAIIKATSQNIKDTLYLQNKTIATWVGSQIIAETQAGILKLPMAPDQLEEKTDMLSQTWQWNASLTATPNPKIQKIDVNIFQPSHHAKIMHLVSYLYAS